MIRAGHLRGARDYLARQTDAEKREYPFLRSWSELLWKEQRVEELSEFVDSIEAKSDDLRGVVVLGQMRKLGLLSDHRRAIEVGLDFLKERARLNDALIAPQIRFCLGTAWLRLRNIEKASAEYDAALAAFQAENQPTYVADCLVAMAQCRRVARDWKGATSLLSEAILLYRSHGQERHSFSPTMNRGTIFAFGGQFGAAREDLEAAARIARNHNRPHWHISALAALALIDTRTGNHTAAANTLATALRIARKTNPIRHTALLYEYIGELRFREGKLRSARVWLKRAMALAETRGLLDIVHEANCRLAEVELQEGDFDLAESHARDALLNFESMKDQYEIAVCQRVLAQVLLSRSDALKASVSEAEDLLTQAAEFFTAVGEDYESRKVLHLLESPGTTPEGEWLSATADPIEANPSSTSALSTATAPSTKEPTRSRRPTKKRAPVSHPQFPELLTTSPTFIECLDRVARLATADANVLILGESGTGKEAIAFGLHRLSSRSEKTYLPLNCASSSGGLFGSELFGHRRGSFTDAREERTGFAKTADGGTLFLDEIAELTLEQQAGILRFLDTGEARAVGSDLAERVNVRIVAATHRDLEVMERDREFRNDLRFRLSELVLQIPALRERKDDIPLLADHFLSEARTRRIGAVKRLSDAVLDKMAKYPWPGNVRELRNEVFRVVAENPNVETVGIWRSSEVERTDAHPCKAELISALTISKGNVSAAGRLLDVNRISLYRLMEKYAVILEDFRVH